MNTSVATRSQRHVTWVALRDERTLPAKVRAYLNRLRERFGFLRNSAWVFANQPEHLLAYATWSETLFDSDGGSHSEQTETD